MSDKSVQFQDAIDDLTTKFSDVIDYEKDEVGNDDDDEYIPLAAMPNDKLPEISFPSNFLEVCVQIVSLQSPSCFYIHLLKKKGAFIKFYAELNDFYNKLGPDPISPALELPLGSHWCVYYKEEWLRVKVTKNMGKHYSEMVYPLLKWNSNPWPKEVINFFRAYFYNSIECKATIMELNGTNNFEVVLELNDLIINEDLVQKGFAESSVIASINYDSLNSNSGTKQSKAWKDCDFFDDTWNPMEDAFIDERNTVHLDDTCAETALLGIQNKDESNLCKFFSKGMRCPRGQICKWPHIIARTDGLPSESETVYCKLQYDLLVPPEGTILKAVVTIVFSPDNFYINICGLGCGGTTDVMTELKKDLSDAYGKSVFGHEISIPAIGELMVLHKAEGSLTGYFRVRVFNVRESDKFNLIKVFYIDYGINEEVPQKLLRKLTNQFLRPPAQAVHCYLEDVLPLGKDWQNSDPASTLFHEVTKDKIVSAMISTHNVQEDKVGLLIENPENAENSVNELIVSAGLGIKKKKYTD